MKKRLACGLLLFSVTGLAYAQVCFDGTISQITVGASDQGGNVLRATTSGGKTYPMDSQYTMTNRTARFMLQQLQTAFLNDYKLVGIDNKGGACDKLNQITLKD